MADRRRDLIASAVSGGRLPSEYQEVEYIEGTGTQYIDAKIRPSKYLNTKLVIAPTQEGQSFGSTKSPYVDYYGCRFSVRSDNLRKLELYYGSSTSFPHLSNWEIDEKMVLEIIDGTFYKNGSYLYSFPLQDFASRNITLFALNHTSVACGFVKIYYCKFYSNSDIVREFIPCYCTTTVIDINGNSCVAGTIGMYDLVNDQFYTNAGTGTFLKGADI